MLQEHGLPFVDGPEAERCGHPAAEVEHLVPGNVHHPLGTGARCVLQDDDAPPGQPSGFADDLALRFVRIVVQGEEQHHDVEGSVRHRDVERILHLQEGELPAPVPVLHEVGHGRMDADPLREPSADPSRARPVVEETIAGPKMWRQASTDLVLSQEHPRKYGSRTAITGPEMMAIPRGSSGSTTWRANRG